MRIIKKSHNKIFYELRSEMLQVNVYDAAFLRVTFVIWGLPGHSFQALKSFAACILIYLWLQTGSLAFGQVFVKIDKQNPPLSWLIYVYWPLNLHIMLVVSRYRHMSTNRTFYLCLLRKSFIRSDLVIIALEHRFTLSILDISFFILFFSDRNNMPKNKSYIIYFV